MSQPRRAPRKLFAPTAPATPPTVAAAVASASSSASSSRPSPYPLRQRTSAAAVVESDDSSGTPPYSPSVSPPPSSSKVKVKTSRASSSAGTPSKRSSKVEDFHSASSPRKKMKAIKMTLGEGEVLPPPPNWQRTLEVLMEQRKRITAPVDTMGCEENGRSDRRADAHRIKPDEVDSEEEKKRERLAVLVGLMLSSQTKDPVTAAAVHNLQSELPHGLTLRSLLEVDATTLNSLISKVGFHNRKTGYILSAARILERDFDGDVPKSVDDLCSLPGVGPKMAFLAMQGAWGDNVGIGVDTHVHRMTQRLGWGPTKDAEGTRLRLQSFLPVEYHRTINKTMVGFGQIICNPIGPRCDLCDVGSEGLCPSYAPIDAKRAAARIKVEMAPKPEVLAKKEEGDVKPGQEEAEFKAVVSEAVAKEEDVAQQHVKQEAELAKLDW